LEAPGAFAERRPATRAFDLNGVIHGAER
jgi:hypothetical protein